MFTSNERVIRDGYLVAFAGEVMSDEEAAARGLTETAESKPAKPKPAKPSTSKPRTKREAAETPAEDPAEEPAEEPAENTSEESKETEAE